MRYGPQRRFEASLEDLERRLKSHARDAHGVSGVDSRCPACSSLLREIAAKKKVLNEST